MFQYVDVFGSVAYQDIINIYGAVYSRTYAFDDAVDFYTKEGYCEDTSLWDPFLVVEVREGGSNMDSEVSI